jgi:hypothetical protein
MGLLMVLDVCGSGTLFPCRQGEMCWSCVAIVLFSGEEALSEKANILFLFGRQVTDAKEQLLSVCTSVCESLDTRHTCHNGHFFFSC